MSLLIYISTLGEWILSNIDKILISVISIIVGYVIYRLIARQVTRLKEQKKLDEHFAYTLNRFVKWAAALAVLSAILTSFGVTLGAISGVLTILGGTILGFAAINTIGNAIAGFIVMTSRPFRIGDRILFKGQFADVIDIELIYTKIQTLDNVLVSVPNQEMLKTEIENYGKEKTIRRQVKITPGYEYESQEVEQVLLDSAKKVPRILSSPEPYVRITEFKDYAIEYTLYVYINEIKKMREIDAELYKAILESCKRNKIDISTALLLRQT